MAELYAHTNPTGQVHIPTLGTTKMVVFMHKECDRQALAGHTSHKTQVTGTYWEVAKVVAGWMVGLVVAVRGPGLGMGGLVEGGSAGGSAGGALAVGGSEEGD